MNFYLAQVFGILAWILLFISYWKNGNNKLLYLQIISCLFFVLNYSFLGAVSGILVVSFEIIRDYLYTKIKNPMSVFMLSIPFYIVISIFSYDGFFSLFSIFASLFDAYALTKKNKKVVVLGIITYVLWLIYDISYASYSTIIPEIILIFSNLIILINYRNAYLNSNKIIFSRGLIINNKIIDEIYKLDNTNFDSDYNWSKDKNNSIIKNNKTDFIFIKIDDAIIGYVHIIKITYDKYYEMVHCKRYVDIDSIDIKRFSKKRSNYININTIAIQNNYQNKTTVDLVSYEIKKYLNEKNRMGYKIKGIVGIATSEFENEIFCNMGFDKITINVSKYYAYCLKIK